MLKYSLILAFIAFSAQIGLCDDHTADTNDGTTEQTPPRKDVYQKLGITSGGSEPDREPAQEQQQQQREEAQPQPSSPDTSDQPIH